MSNQPATLDDESARWTHDLEHLVWALPATRRRPCPPCAATLRNGQPCKALAVRGDTLCASHSGRRRPRQQIGPRRRPGRPAGVTRPSVPATPLVAAIEARGLAVTRRSSSAARAFHRAKLAGRLTVDAAEKITHELLDEHPATIWGDLWWEASSRS